MGWFLLFCFLVGHQLTCSWRQCLANVVVLHWTLMGLFSCCCSPWFPAPPGPTDCGTATSPDKRNIISSKQSTFGMYTGQCTYECCMSAFPHGILSFLCSLTEGWSPLLCIRLGIQHVAIR
jgi:hypothetical protein